MAATMSVFCLIETNFNDSKSGVEFGDAVFKIGPQSYEKFKWEVFYNTCKGSHSKQCQSFNENDIVHIFGKFTFIKVDGIKTIAVSYLLYFDMYFIKNFYAQFKILLFHIFLVGSIKCLYI